uniref:DUF2510 domain-containing protein n=1 Tax=Macrostomum lignano TaxID=282301 RepID=A0A1I8FAK1_9PLAT
MPAAPDQPGGVAPQGPWRSWSARDWSRALAEAAASTGQRGEPGGRAGGPRGPAGGQLGRGRARRTAG